MVGRVAVLGGGGGREGRDWAEVEGDAVADVMGGVVEAGGGVGVTSMGALVEVVTCGPGIAGLASDGAASNWWTISECKSFDQFVCLGRENNGERGIESALPTTRHAKMTKVTSCDNS